MYERVSLGIVAESIYWYLKIQQQLHNNVRTNIYLFILYTLFAAVIYRLTSWLVKFKVYKTCQHIRKYWNPRLRMLKSRKLFNANTTVSWSSMYRFKHVVPAIWLEIGFLETLNLLVFSVAILICTFRLSLAHMIWDTFLRVN